MSSRLLSKTALWLTLTAVSICLISLVTPRHARDLFMVGLIIGVFAYLAVLLENFEAGRSIPTRNAKIDRQTAPIAYCLCYLMLLFIGLLAIIVFLTILIFK